MTEANDIPQGEIAEEQPAADMEFEAETLLESVAPGNGSPKPEENGTGKRGREAEEEVEEGENADTKKQKVEKSVEEERLENFEEKVGGEREAVEDEEEGEGEGKEEHGVEKAPVSIGPKVFNSSQDMFDYFYKLLHYWTPNLDINKYEHMAILDLLKKGHPVPSKKIGEGIQAFQVRYHPMWKSRCFFLVRVDGSVDDFSFRKCVDHILPLPDNMKVSESNRALNGSRNGGHQKGGGRGGSGGRGRGRRGRF